MVRGRAFVECFLSARHCAARHAIAGGVGIVLLMYRRWLERGLPKVALLISNRLKIKPKSVCKAHAFPTVICPFPKKDFLSAFLFWGVCLFCFGTLNMSLI